MLCLSLGRYNKRTIHKTNVVLNETNHIWTNISIRMNNLKYSFTNRTSTLPLSKLHNRSLNFFPNTVIIQLIFHVNIFVNEEYIIGLVMPSKEDRGTEFRCEFDLRSLS